MEKLSSIIPASARVKSVDLSEAKPRRPGAPDFGVPVANSSFTPKDKVSLNSSALEASKDTLTYRNPKDAKGARIAEEMTRKFFETRLMKDELSVPKSQATMAMTESNVVPSASSPRVAELPPVEMAGGGSGEAEAVTE